MVLETLQTVYTVAMQQQHTITQTLVIRKVAQPIKVNVTTACKLVVILAFKRHRLIKRTTVVIMENINPLITVVGSTIVVTNHQTKENPAPKRGFS